MPGPRILNFHGMIPRLDGRLLDYAYAILAIDVDLEHGDLMPWRCGPSIKTCSSPIKTVFDAEGDAGLCCYSEERDFAAGVPMAIEECFGSGSGASISDVVNPGDPEAPGPGPEGPIGPSSDVCTVWFEPEGTLVQVLDGHDNGITTKAADDTIYLVTGDGFVGGIKRETSVFSLAPGADPMVPGNWVFQRELNGKCYGARCVGNTLYLLVSDTGSLWLGTQNVRIYNYNADTYSGSTLQEKLDHRGINWFIVNSGTEEDTLTIGCVVATENEFYAGTTPVQLWVGDPSNLDSFQYVTPDMGLPAMDATTVSVTAVGGGSWIAGVGDFKRGEIYQFCADDLYGTWNLVDVDNVSPPMDPTWDWPIYAGKGFVAGPFTLNYFETNGQWYRCVTGTGSDTNDGTYIQKVIRGEGVVPPEAGEIDVDISVIDSVTGASFFSLALLDDATLLGGTYSEGTPVPEIRRDGAPIISIDSGESIFSMAPDGGTLYITTENNGGLYRAVTSTWVVNQIATLQGGVFNGAFDVRVIDGQVIAIGGGEIYVVNRGTVLNFSSDYYVKSVYKLFGQYWVPGYHIPVNRAGWFVSSDLINWGWQDGISAARYMRGNPNSTGTEAVIAGTQNYSGNTHNPDSACLFIHNADGVEKKHHFTGYDYSSVALYEDDNTIIAGLTRRWRSQTPGAQLVRIQQDSVQVLATFDEAELRDIVIHGDSYYVATRTDTVGGKIYRVRKV